MAYQTMTTREAAQRGERMGRGARSINPSYQAFSLLYAGFIGLPVIAGVDKFFHLLVDWTVYASPVFAAAFGGNVVLMMRIVGVVEIAAGILVALRPRLGGLVVAGWLAAIVVNLLLIPGFLDVALRDIGLMVGALALSRLAAQFEG